MASGYWHYCSLQGQGKTLYDDVRVRPQKFNIITTRTACIVMSLTPKYFYSQHFLEELLDIELYSR